MLFFLFLDILLLSRLHWQNELYGIVLRNDIDCSKHLHKQKHAQRYSQCILKNNNNDNNGIQSLWAAAVEGNSDSSDDGGGGGDGG